MKAIAFILLPASLLLQAMDNHKHLRLVCEATAYSALAGLALIDRRKFESLRNPNASWFLPWAYARFTVPTNVRIVVREVNSLSPWYTEKLGLRKLIDPPRGDEAGAEFKFTTDGNSFVLTTKQGLLPPKTPILFTKRIGRMRDALAARGVYAESIRQDRQGIRYFNIHDPEGNVIEIVEDR